MDFKHCLCNKALVVVKALLMPSKKRGGKEEGRRGHEEGWKSRTRTVGGTALSPAFFILVGSGAMDGTPPLAPG
jgi:hypothetical protein